MRSPVRSAQPAAHPIAELVDGPPPDGESTDGEAMDGEAMDGGALTGDADTRAGRVLARCGALAEVSARPGRVDRHHLTREHAAANALVAGWMREAGMRTWVDAAGNVCGRLGDDDRPALLLGSHLDTVPDAGRYDGPLGVVAAIEVVDALRDTALRLPVALEVVGFSGEEGTRFGTALLGSRALAGPWDDTWWHLTDADGTTLREAFAAFGLDPERVGDAARPAGSVLAYLELHIEQGPELEDVGLALGVVRAIAGARRFQLTVHGEAGHAGGTPLERRRDALVGASHVVLAVERIAREREVLATVGRAQAYPGGVNVVPGRVELGLDLRAARDADRDDAWLAISRAVDRCCAERGLTWSAVEDHRAPAVATAPWLRHALERAVASTGQVVGSSLLSGAGHDAMAVADLTDVGMLFVRCAGGISHHPDEAVAVDDVEQALAALTFAVRAVAGDLTREPGR